MNDKEILKEVHDVCSKTLKLIQEQPTKSDMKLLILESIDEHYSKCPAVIATNGLREKTAENTAVIRLLTKARDSIAPKSSCDYTGWIKFGLIIAGAILSALGIEIAVD